MKIGEHIPMPTGTLRLNVFKHDRPDGPGRLIDSIVERNLIVDGAKNILSALLGAGTSAKIVTKIGFGTDGTAPTGSNTGLTGAYVKSLGTPTYPAGAVTFPFTLGTSEANGINIIEFGLLTTDNTLFSRRVRSSAIAKDNTLSFTGTWTIQF
jgi:hypothetical protein